MTKEESARATIAAALPGHPAATLCSFGKDSLVVLDLLSSFGVSWVLHGAGPDETLDPEYVQALVDRYGLRVTYLPKGRGHLLFVGTRALFLSLVSVTPEVYLPFPTTLGAFAGESDFVCIDDELRARHGSLIPDGPDLVFSGQKATDLERTTCETVHRYLPAADRAAITAKMRADGPCSTWGSLRVCAPLLDWTDAEVWGYIERHDLPVSARMYDGRARRHASRPTCTRCYEPHGPATVMCPRTRAPLTNLGHFTKDTGLSGLAALGVVTAGQAAALEAAYAD